MDGWSLEYSRVYGIFVKKAICSWRKRVIVLIQLLFPVVTVLLLLVDFSFLSSNETETLVLDLTAFGKTYIPYTDGLPRNTSKTSFADVYAKQFGSSHQTEYVRISTENTFDNYTLKRALEMRVPAFNRKMIIGMEVKNVEPSHMIEAVAYFHGNPYHTEAISVNYLLNAMLQFTFNDTFSLQTAIHPQIKDFKSTPDDENEGEINGVSIGLLLCFGMSIMTSLFIIFIIQEREVGAKHLQTICGVGPLTYWLPTFLWDFINYIIPSLAIVLLFLANKSGMLAYVDDGRWILTVLVLALYGWAVLPHLYAFQYLFKSPASGVCAVIILGLLTGIFGNLIIYIVGLLIFKETPTVKTIRMTLMSLSPTYNLGSCLINIYTNYKAIQSCDPYLEICNNKGINVCCQDTCEKILGLCVHFNKNYISWDLPGIGELLVFMFLHGVVCSLIVMMIEYHIIHRLWYCVKSDSIGNDIKDASFKEDVDVETERNRIISSKDSRYADSLVIVNLYKKYTDVPAVNNVCLGIHEQECFGLLGQNGAGKTTTFKMLTGDVIIGGGNAYFKGFDVKTNIRKVQANLGYCPQFDALINELTGRETLTLYARLRGIPGGNIKMVVELLAETFLITPHIDKYTSQYSGGNKRKLSTAVALIGGPALIMLDEPSAGVDPEARRQLWNVLSKVRASGCTLILTSHRYLMNTKVIFISKFRMQVSNWRTSST